ncbi:MAG TPA: hypothetical protein VEV44_16285 [Pseudoneobacillus sp.]|nr:hypothetical protein [Pseudoneobacillus sp.]
MEQDIFTWFDFLKLIGLVLSPIWITLIVMVLNTIFYFFKYRFFYKMSLPVPDVEKRKMPGFFYKLMVQFPKTFIDDMFNRDPDEFLEHGLHMVCGEQGSGKSTFVIYKLLELKAKYPKSKIRTNMDYKNQDGEITHWKELVQNDNGIYGQVEVLDEIQTWFSSLQSKDFPPEMITEISQQRKQRKMILGTAQVFSRIAKPIREQTTYVYMPITIFGCLTIVRITKPRFWDDEKQEFKKYIKTTFFVHTPEVRNAFDTYKKIEKYKAEGFKEDRLRVAE